MTDKILVREPREGVVKPHFLPDLDDESMTYVFAYIKNYEQDLLWSFSSDFCFILGSTLYLLLACCEFFQKDVSYCSLLELLAPLAFLFNASVDIQWATQVRQRHQVKKAMKQTFDQSSDKNSTQETTGLRWWQRIRIHTAHRRTVYAASTFGIAAFFALVSVLLDYGLMEDTRSWYSILFDGASDHMYMVSALIAISGRRTRPWFAPESQYCGSILNEPETLEDIGDFLFLVGSLLDAFLDDIHKDGVPIFGIVSAVLWFVDALFYLRSDFVMAHRVNEKAALDEDDPSTVLV